MVSFSGILDIGQVEDLQMMTDKRWKEIVSRFKGKLIKMSKDVNGKFYFTQN